MLNIAGLKLPMIGDNIVTGNVYFVDSGATGTSDSNDGLRPDGGRVLATIAGAFDKVTASNGDYIIVMPGHTEAPTATIDIDVAGVSLIGVGNGRNRPTITHAHTVDHDHVFECSAANVLIKNIRFAAGTNGAGHSEQINISADDVAIEDCVIEMGAANEVGISVEGGSDRFRIENCLFLGTGSSQADVCIDLEGSGGHDDYVVRNCDFNFMTGGGLDLAGIRSSKTDTGFIIENCTFIECNVTAIDFNSAAEGLIKNVTIHTSTATIAELLDIGNAMIQDLYAGGAAKLAVLHATATLAD